MLEDVRRNVRSFVEAGMSAVTGALTPSRARELARGLSGGEGSRQVNRVAQDLLEWSARSREWISEAVAKEVKRQLSGLGIATRDDIDSLRKRVRELERSSGGSSRSGSKRSAAGAKASGARKAGSARRTASGGARRAPARRTASADSTGSTATNADPAADATGLGDPGTGTT